MHKIKGFSEKEARDTRENNSYFFHLSELIPAIWYENIFLLLHILYNFNKKKNENLIR